MPLTNYIVFALAHGRFLAFGVLLAFISSAGQTYFIGVFGPEVRAEFGLSHTEWGSLYLVGTLASALLLPWTGQLIDRFDLRVFAAGVLLVLATACIAMSLANSIVFLGVAIFLLRQSGQGLTSHAAAVSMARYHGRDRGKALAISTIGFSAAEALLPVLAVVAIAFWGWRQTYAMVGIAVLLVVPIALWLLRGHGHRHDRHLAELHKAASDGTAARDRTRRQMLSEARFYLMLPAVLAPSFIMTAMFFHHLTLAEAKGWSAAWVTGSYWVYALSTVVTSLAAGPLIDRLSAARIVPLFLLPMALSLVLLAPAEAAFWVLPYFLFAGISSGLHFTGLAALWAELYGSKHLGAIKSLAGSLSVFASALGPVTIGFVLDTGGSMEGICLGFAAYCVVATLLLVPALRRPGAEQARGT